MFFNLVLKYVIGKLGIGTFYLTIGPDKWELKVSKVN